MATGQLHGWYEEPMGVWQELANCLGVDPDLYFPEKWDAEQSYAITRPICAACEVRDECREYAIENRMDSGMWGGMTANDLRKERKRRLREEREMGQDDG